MFAMRPVSPAPSSAPRNNLSLPSIREMFPDYIVSHPAPRVVSGTAEPTARLEMPHNAPAISRETYINRGLLRRRESAPSAHNYASPHHGPSLPPPPEPPRPRSHTGPSTGPHSKSGSYSHSYSHGPIPTPQARQVPVEAPAYSFDVLRSDPATSKLEHIASSTSLRNRNPGCVPQAASTGIANGSSPAFRVTMPQDLASSTAESHARRTIEQFSNNISDSQSPSDHSSSPLPSPPVSDSPTIFSFPITGSPASMMASSSAARKAHRRDDGSNSNSRYYRGENRGKKHECPHCAKRFNRPSSLRIHVNTHTGAKPFQCPHPSCGREFNVNSNMRRHYRNHARNRSSRLQAVSDDLDDEHHQRGQLDGAYVSSTTSPSIGVYNRTMSLLTSRSQYQPASPGGGSASGEYSSDEMDDHPISSLDDDESEDELEEDDDMEGIQEGTSNSSSHPRGYSQSHLRTGSTYEADFRPQFRAPIPPSPRTGVLSPDSRMHPSTHSQNSLKPRHDLPRVIKEERRM